MEKRVPHLSRAILLFLELAATACAGFREPGFGDAGVEVRPSSPSASGTAMADAVGQDGGRVSRLYFAVVGDTRPATVDDTSGYPSTVIATIFRDLQSLDPPPPFAVSTGDYIFASARGGQAGPQLALYLRARAVFSGTVFPAMGNHECTGATASNCGPANADGMTENYSQFLATMLAPLGRTRPYYSFDIGASNGSWTAKFVVVAANAWDSDQAVWLEASLARPTTYTFLVRHEPASAAAAPGVIPSEQILARYPYTLAIVGHSHTYARTGPREVTIGNGGAPLTSPSANYGFGLVQQRTDGAVQVDAVDYATMKRDPSFGFAVNPDGSVAP